MGKNLRHFHIGDAIADLHWKDDLDLWMGFGAIRRSLNTAIGTTSYQTIHTATGD